MIEVVVDIRYTHDAWRSLHALPRKEMARRLRQDLDALKLPHPPEETISMDAASASIRFSWTKARHSYLHNLIKTLVRDQDIAFPETKRSCGIVNISLTEEKPRPPSERELMYPDMPGRTVHESFHSGPSKPYPFSKHGIELVVHIRYTPDKAQWMFGDPAIHQKQIASRLRMDLEDLKMPHPPEMNIWTDAVSHTISFSWTTKRESPLYRFVDNLVRTQDTEEILKNAKATRSIETIRMTEEKPRPPPSKVYEPGVPRGPESRQSLRFNAGNQRRSFSPPPRDFKTFRGRSRSPSSRSSSSGDRRRRSASPPVRRQSDGYSGAYRDYHHNGATAKWSSGYQNGAGPPRIKPPFKKGGNSIELVVRFKYTPEKARLILGDSNISQKELADRLRADLLKLRLPQPPEAKIEAEKLSNSICFSWTTTRNSHIYQWVSNAAHFQDSSHFLREGKRDCEIERIILAEEEPRPLPTSSANSSFASTSTSASTHVLQPLPVNIAQRSPSPVHVSSRKRAVDQIESVQTALRQLEQSSLGQQLKKRRLSDDENSHFLSVGLPPGPVHQPPPLPPLDIKDPPIVVKVCITWSYFGILELMNEKVEQTDDADAFLKDLFSNRAQPARGDVIHREVKNADASKAIVETKAFTLTRPKPAPQPAPDPRASTPSGLIQTAPVSRPPPATAPVASGANSEHISRLTREFWDTRRMLTALSSKAGLLQTRLKGLGVADQYQNRSLQELQANLSEAEKRLADERAKREQLERLLLDIQRECAQPVVIPALLAALQPNFQSQIFK
ncbi:hypothetical protein VKT23_019481 [Stygiomarasmius scandens]|uniref:Uncharacterized protein n=1 Tax=Marasmiellus scandens TaxID=2682957 RepID=A0ABR1ILI9_9AGAR